MVSRQPQYRPQANLIRGQHRLVDRRFQPVNDAQRRPVILVANSGAAGRNIDSSLNLRPE
jgi:hypothetical protein